MNNIQKHIDKLIYIVTFLSVLLIGADMFSVEIKYTFKLPQLLLMLLTGLLIITKKYKVRKDKLMIAFLATSLVSTIFALNISLAIAYYMFIVVNAVTIYYCISSFVQEYGIKKMVDLLRITFFVQFGILIFQYLLVVLFKFEIPFMPSYGEHLGIPRFRLWFYEPSYMATYVLVWLTLGLTMLFIYGKKDYIKDVTCSTIMLVLSTSTSGFIGIVAAFGLVFVIWCLKGWKKEKLIIPGVMILIFIAIRFIFPDMYDHFIGRLFSESLNDASGGRIDKWMESIKVIIDRPLLGVGPGNYGNYFGDSIEYVPSNVTLDLVSTLGFFGLLFYGLHITLGLDFYKLYKTKIAEREEFKLVFGLLMGLFIFVLILQVNQGYLRLYHWMLLGIIYGSLRYLENELEKDIKSRRRVKR